MRSIALGWCCPGAPLDGVWEPSRYEHLAYMLEAVRFGAEFFAGTGEHRVRVRPVMRCSSMTAVHEAALAGAGAALMPHWLIKQDLAAGRLISWGVVPNRNIEAWALHTSTRLTSPKVKAFVEALVDEYRS